MIFGLGSTSPSRNARKDLRVVIFVLLLAPILTTVPLFSPRYRWIVGTIR